MAKWNALSYVTLNERVCSFFMFFLFQWFMSAVFSPCLIVHFDVFLRYVIFIIFSLFC